MTFKHDHFEDILCLHFRNSAGQSSLSGPVESCSLVANGKDQELGEYKMKSLPLFTNLHWFVFIFSLLYTYIVMTLNSTISKLFNNTVKGSIYLHIKIQGGHRGRAKLRSNLFYLWIKRDYKKSTSSLDLVILCDG